MDRFGLQLYTVRKILTEENAKEIMKEIRKAGYSYVQAAGDLKNIEKQGVWAMNEGLSVVGSVTDINTVFNNIDETVRVHKAIGAIDVGVSGFFGSPRDVEEFIRKANVVSEALSKENLTFSYHNHSGEFIKLDNGRSAFEMLMEGLSSKNTYYMPDTYWIQHGGADVRHYIEKLKGRIKILHLKDAKMTPDGLTFAEIGKGNLFWEGIIETAKNSCVEWFVVEQDKCDNSPLHSIKNSAEYLLKL